MSTKPEITGIGYAGPDEFGHGRIIRDWHIDNHGEAAGWTYDELRLVYLRSVEFGDGAALAMANGKRCAGTGHES